MSFEMLGNILKPWGRALKYGTLKRNAERRVARFEAADNAHTDGPIGRDASGAANGYQSNGTASAISLPASPAPPQTMFLIGCGRSGTTIVGEVLGRHQQIEYFFEPYHLWATVDPRIDVLNLYHEGPSRLLLDEAAATPQAVRRFDVLFMQHARQRQTPVVVEKTPFNACRIGYLETLRPGSKYVHLVRDGVDVARSIARLSRDRSYAIAGKTALNRWWGRNGCKWNALSLDGKAAGYFADEVGQLRSEDSRGAYEWIVSLAELDAWRDRLRDRLLEMSYEQLTNNPRESLKSIADFLGIDATGAWLEKSAAQIDKPRRNKGEKIVLPPKMCHEFNAHQERFGFVERAEPGAPRGEQVRVAFVSNEPTPYRLHVLNRLLKELPEARFESIFTHTISKPTMPWEMTIDPELNPVFFPDVHLSQNQPISIRSIPLYLRIMRFLREKEIRLVIILGYNDLTRLMTIHACHRNGIPIALTADSNVFADARTSDLVRMFKGPLVRAVLRRLTALMPMGTCGRAFYRRYLDHDLPEFLFPYEPDYTTLEANDAATIAAFREKRGMPAARKRMLYCGRLIKIKRVDLLIEAFCAVAPRRPDWDLVIAGDGPRGRKLQASVPIGLRHRVIWLGFTQFDQVKLAYQCCDVLVHPAEFEPWGLIINEATACNLPIITTSVVGAAVELVKHNNNGLIVPPRDADALAEAMLKISDGDVCEQMKPHCKPRLDAWRKAADPVEGIRQALRHFGFCREILPPLTAHKRQTKIPKR